MKTLLGWGKNIPGTGNTYFKGPKMEGNLKLSRHGKSSVRERKREAGRGQTSPGTEDTVGELHLDLIIMGRY